MDKSKMARVLTRAQVQESEAQAAANGLSEDILIENAATALKEAVFSLTDEGDRICVLAGGGNNGADGLSLARALHLAGQNVCLVLPACERRSSANQRRLAAARALGVPELAVGEFDPRTFAVIVDALLGTGCTRPPEGEFLQLIREINEADSFVLSVDVPSGLNADTGEAPGEAVFADETLTFSHCKIGQLAAQGRNYCGNLVVADIGLRYENGAYAVCGDALTLPRRKCVSHKYNYGKVRIVAGSPTMIGASLLAHESALAALKSGAGLCTLCVPASLKTVYMQRVKEETLYFLPDTDGKITFDPAALDGLFEKTGAILLGPGLGQNESLCDTILYIAKKFSGTLVLDADGLNAVAPRLPELENHVCKLILTPHLGEFERLCADYVQKDGIVPRTKALAKRLGAVVAAKSATTVISDGEDVFLNCTGTPAQAKGGSGDVLGGMIAAFACRMPPLDAAVTACYHFGKCAEVAQRLYGQESLLASDVIIK